MVRVIHIDVNGVLAIASSVRPAIQFCVSISKPPRKNPLIADVGHVALQGKARGDKSICAKNNFWLAI